MIKNASYVWKKLKGNLDYALRQQVGVDISVKEVHKITDSFIIANDRGSASSVPANKIAILHDSEGFFNLEPNTAYEIVFNEGLHQLSLDETAFIIQRSSLNRSGVRVQGSVFDPGFWTDNLGATLYTSNTSLALQENARIAQIQIFSNDPIEDETKYNGQYNGK
jgi:deoxycytidine triphosphate deaminase